MEDVCAAENTNVWVALDAGSTVGFVAVKLHSEDSMGKSTWLLSIQTFKVATLVVL